ncbi:hypothetical protein X560_2402 [Listeria fleischmannii 1991]|uniref:Uncharacterized protein n=1 Tax=Listeria fleischmannii 1991 TaxID=1430899 RepID=A0A0J8GB62_9LIST|nr:hypothetical protein X560_2402 [Listeria fleischmannii 1991]
MTSPLNFAETRLCSPFYAKKNKVSTGENNFIAVFWKKA